jgi:cysteinyl-tRNA synthetase
MSKSLGNFITVKDFLDKYKNANLLKLLFLSTHYSHPVDYTDEKIQEARQALDRISILWGKIGSLNEKKLTGSIPAELDAVKNKFISAMDDDFNMPQALACVFELVNISNKNINDQEFISLARKILQEMLDIFGITLKSPDLNVFVHDNINSAEEVESKIKERNKARKNKDFALSDKIREELESQGIILEDTKGGTTWRKKL